MWDELVSGELNNDPGRGKNPSTKCTQACPRHMPRGAHFSFAKSLFAFVFFFPQWQQALNGKLSFSMNTHQGESVRSSGLSLGDAEQCCVSELAAGAGSRKDGVCQGSTRNQPGTALSQGWPRGPTLLAHREPGHAQDVEMVLNVP